MNNTSHGSLLMDMEILVVDDCQNERDLLSLYLKKEGYKIRCASTGEEALAAVKSSIPDIILLDIMLPDIEGFEICRRLKSNEITKKIPVIFISAKREGKDIVEGLRRGGVDYIIKPFAKEEVLARVRNQLELRVLLKLHEQSDQELKKSAIKLQETNKTLEEYIDKHEAAQDRMVQTEKLAGVGRLTAGVCHEILNPLNIISGQTQALILERSEDGELIQDLNMIMEEIGRIDKIIDGLLAFSRRGTNQSVLLEVNMELESLLSFLESDMSHDGIKVVRKFAEDLPSIKADSDQLRQVFFNIINNAKYAMGEGGRLTISTEVFVPQGQEKRDDSQNEEGYVCIKISDTGSGIKKENIKKIFEPFFTTKPINTGTGLGLSVCHSIVEQNGGTLDVKSEYGEGTTFIILMPVNNQNDESVEQTSQLFIDQEEELGQEKWDSVKPL